MKLHHCILAFVKLFALKEELPWTNSKNILPPYPGIKMRDQNYGLNMGHFIENNQCCQFFSKGGSCCSADSGLNTWVWMDPLTNKQLGEALAQVFTAMKTATNPASQNLTTTCWSRCGPSASPPQHCNCTIRREFRWAIITWYCYGSHQNTCLVCTTRHCIGTSQVKSHA